VLLFFDAEVYPHDWLFVIIDPASQEKHVFINDARALASFMNNTRIIFGLVTTTGIMISTS